MDFRKACGPVVCGGQRGTGYLVSKNRMVTCWHVVQESSQASVVIGKKTLTAAVNAELSRKESDIAVLDLPEDIGGIAPLQFAEEAEDDADWSGVGYPVTSRKALPVPLHGTILEIDGVDVNDCSSVILHSEQAAAGEGARMGGFSGSPVVVGGLVVGHVKRIFEDPDRKGYPLYGQLYAVPSRDILSALKLQPAQAKPTTPPSPGRGTEVLLRELESNRHSAGRVFEMWDLLRSSGALEDAVSVRAAELLIAQARPELALEVLKAAGTGVRAQQLTALALSKLGKEDTAVGILEKLAQANDSDPIGYRETHGMLAGRYRLRSKPGEEFWLRKSYDEYRKPWDRDGDTYCGINAATTALQIPGLSATAAEIAQRVLSKLPLADADQLDHWQLATAAEAELVADNLPAAKDWYQRAVRKQPTLFADLATIRGGARRILSALGKPTGAVDDCFPAMSVAAFFGHDVDAPGRVPPRLPRELVGRVREALIDYVTRLKIRFGISCACRGSDLLFLRAVLDSSGDATVILPCNRADFTRMFVGEQWRERFDYVAAHERTQIREITPEADRDLWVKCRDEIRKELRNRSGALSDQRRLLVVWDETPGYVGEAVATWEDDGDPVEKITLAGFTRPTSPCAVPAS